MNSPHPCTHNSLLLQQAALAGQTVGFTCPVCNSSVHKEAWFNSEAAQKEGNLREHGECPICGATNRYRQLAHVLTRVMGALTGKALNDLSDLGDMPLKIYNTQCSGALNTHLQKANGHTCSEYFPEATASGVIIEGVLHQDLQATSFPDAEFDLVISSEVFEHIPGESCTQRLLSSGQSGWQAALG